MIPALPKNERMLTVCDHSNEPGGREAAMTVLSEKVWCDPCIAPIVKALNDADLTTVASCCGHGRRPGRISLTDGRELFIGSSFEEGQAIDLALNGAGFPGINGERLPQDASPERECLCDPRFTPDDPDETCICGGVRWQP